jgi:hypothetical protein
MGDFREEQIWREARLLTAALHQLTEAFPAELASRIRSACISLLDSLARSADLSLSRQTSGSTRKVSRLAEQLDAEIHEAYERGLMERPSFSSLEKETELLRQLLKRESTTQP